MPAQPVDPLEPRVPDAVEPRVPDAVEPRVPTSDADGAAPVPDPPPRPSVAPVFTTRTRTGSRRRRARRRRRTGLAMLLLGGVLLLAAVWIAVTGLLARSQLQQARSAIGALRTHVAQGDLTAAAADVRAVQLHAGRAHTLTGGPAWALAADLPAGGQAFDTVRGLAGSADRLAHDVLPQLLAARRELDPATLHGSQGRVDVARIAAAAPAITRAAADLDRELAALRALPAHTWLAPADDARAASVTQLEGIRGTVRSADLAARILPPVLGAGRPARYFVAFQNGAEARGTGGVAGAFGILDASGGRLRFERFESDDALDGVHARVDLGADFDQLYRGADPTGLYVNSNLSANFPYAARIWASMWQGHTGERLDGAIALDPAALSYLLGAVNASARLSDGTTVTAGNVASLTQSVVYQRFAGRTAARRAYLKQIAQRSSAAILGAQGGARPLVDALLRAADERRLLLWSADADVERLVAQTAFAGTVADTSRPYVGLSVVNDGGNKLDYYLDRSVSWERTGCGATRTVTATVRLHNDAPTGLPAYVTERTDRHGYRVRPGDNRLLVSWYATQGAQLTGATVDGRPVGVHVGAELGHPVYTADVELPRAATRTLVLHLREPVGRGAPLVLRQPLVRPLQVRVGDAQCG